jgi:activator of HSP90 ATPase
MNDKIDQADRLTRRQAIAGMAIAFGSLAAGSTALGDPQPPAKEAPGAANLARTSIHQEVDLKANPQRIFDALLDPRQFAAFSGRPAEIDPREGGAFSLFGGLIVGRNVELVPGQRVVQAWRPAHWDPGVYSIARFELRPQESGTRIVFDHTGFPEGEHDQLLSGWNGHYWGPLAKFLT